MNSLKRREFVTAADRLSLIIAEVPRACFASSLHVLDIFLTWVILKTHTKLELL